MRILTITNFYPPHAVGGWEQLTRDVVDMLSQRGHVVAVVTSDYGVTAAGQPEPGIARVLKLESADLVNYRRRGLLQRPWHERSNRRALTRITRAFQPDIIFINGMWNLPAAVAADAEQLYPGRVIYYMASYWPIEPGAHHAYWRGERGLLPRLLGPLVGPLLGEDRRQALAFPRVLCVSDYMRRRMIEEAGIPEAQTRVVYNGVESDLFTYRQRLPHAGGLRLLYAGRLSPDKGVHTILEGLGHLQETNALPPVRLTIVGAGAPAYRRHLEQLIDRQALSSIIDIKGVVRRREMPAIFDAHDVLLFPSIWPEPLARVVQEAMAAGLMVIGSDTGGTPELLRDGETGLVFPAGDGPALAAQICRAADDPDLRLRLARSGRKVVAREFTLGRMVDELEQEFRQVNDSQRKLHGTA